MGRPVPGRGRIAAVLDVGTNSVLLLVASPGPEEGLVALAEGMRITRLGEGLAGTGFLDQEAIARTVEACRAFRAEARLHGARDILAVGTEAARAAKNAADLRRAIEAADVPFHVLEPAEEARLSYAGVRCGLRIEGLAAVADIGGGSTELILGDGRNVRSVVSVPVGCLRTPAAPGGGEPGRIRAARQRLAAAIEPVIRDLDVKELIGVGGSVTTCAALERRMTVYVRRRIHGFRLRRDAVASWVARLNGMRADERRSLPGMVPGRETSLPTGLELVEQVMMSLGARELRVSTSGLRHGVVLRLWSGDRPA